MLTFKLVNERILIFSFAGSKYTYALSEFEFCSGGQIDKNAARVASTVALREIEDIFKMCRVVGSRLLKHKKSLAIKTFIILMCIIFNPLL